MNRKDLQEKYNIIGENKDITLFSKGPAKRGIGYTGNISLANGKAKFNATAKTKVRRYQNPFCRT